MYFSGVRVCSDEDGGGPRARYILVYTVGANSAHLELIIGAIRSDARSPRAVGCLSCVGFV